MSGWITDTPASTRFPVYTRSNASDVLPDPISPLGASLSWTPGVMEGWRDGNVDNGAFEMAELTAEGLNPTCGFFNGFFYVNASVVRVFGERSGAGADGVDAAFFGNRPDTPPYVPHADDANESAGARIAERVGWVLSTHDYPELDAHRDEANEARSARPDLGSLSDAELVERARVMTPKLRSMFNDHVITSSNTAIGPTILGQIVPDLMLRLIAGAGDVDSAGAQPRHVATESDGARHRGVRRRLRGLPRRLRLSWTQRVGHLLGHVGDQTRPGPRTRRRDARGAHRSIARGAGRTRRRGPRAGDEEALGRVQGDEEATGTVIAAQASALRFNAWRERSKTNCVKVINEQRVALRELASRHLGTAFEDERDVFLLLDAELDAFVADPASVADTVRERKHAWQALWELEPPYFVQSDQGIPTLDSLLAKTVGGGEAAAVGTVLTGAAGCSGIVEGVARVILDPSDPTALEPGDILIAPNTDPSWTPLFVPAGGVVVGVGAMNSHAVIVSREMGIPCVVSVTDCTKRIPDGAVVRVDGGAGTVTLL